MRSSKGGIKKTLNLETNIKEGFADDVSITNELVKRIPFLEDYAVSVKKISQLKADFIGEKVKGIQMMNSKKKIIMIQEYAPVSRFMFIMNRIDNNQKKYIFSVKNFINITPNGDIDSESLSSLLFAQKQISKNHSFMEEIILDDRDNGTMLLTNEKFTEIINKINEAFYNFHEIIEKQEIPDF